MPPGLLQIQSRSPRRATCRSHLPTGEGCRIKVVERPSRTRSIDEKPRTVKVERAPEGIRMRGLIAVGPIGNTEDRRPIRRIGERTPGGRQWRSGRGRSDGGPRIQNKDVAVPTPAPIAGEQDDLSTTIRRS